MQIRLDIKGLQAWKQTLRFRPAAPQPAPAGAQDMFVVDEDRDG
jgi:hypothetical protein